MNHYPEPPEAGSSPLWAPACLRQAVTPPNRELTASLPDYRCAQQYGQHHSRGCVDAPPCHVRWPRSETSPFQNEACRREDGTFFGPPASCKVSPVAGGEVWLRGRRRLMGRLRYGYAGNWQTSQGPRPTVFLRGRPSQRRGDTTCRGAPGVMRRVPAGPGDAQGDRGAAKGASGGRTGQYAKVR